MEVSVLLKVRGIIHYTLDNLRVMLDGHYTYIFPPTRLYLYCIPRVCLKEAQSQALFNKKKKKKNIRALPCSRTAELIDPYYPCFRHGLEWI